MLCNYGSISVTFGDQEKLDVDTVSVIEKMNGIKTLSGNTTFDIALANGSTVSYTSNNTSVLSIDNEGNVTVNRPAEGAGDATVVVTYSVSLNGLSSSTYSVSIAVKENSSSTEIDLIGNFICTAKDLKTAPDGWTLSVGKGSYASPFWQSFRNDGEYALSPKFAEQTSIDLSFTYYLNFSTYNSNGSSKIKFEGLDVSGKVVATHISDELYINAKGIENAKTVTGTLAGTGIVQVKVSFVKNSGANIAFSTISIVTTKAS